MAPVGVTEEWTEDAVALRLAGELDAATAGDCLEALRRVVSTVPPPWLVVLDLGGLDLVAAAGVHALSTVARSCARRGVRTAVVLPGDLRRVLEPVTGADWLPVFHTVQDAVRAQRRR